MVPAQLPAFELLSKKSELRMIGGKYNHENMQLEKKVAFACFSNQMLMGVGRFYPR
jgi:hypothetical protein